MRLEVDCSTGTQVVRPLSDEEVAGAAARVTAQQLERAAAGIADAGRAAMRTQLEAFRRKKVRTPADVEAAVLALLALGDS